MNLARISLPEYSLVKGESELPARAVTECLRVCEIRGGGTKISSKIAFELSNSLILHGLIEIVPRGTIWFGNYTNR